MQPFVKWAIILIIIDEIDPQGYHTAHFHPVSEFEAPESIEKLCSEYEATLDQGTIDPRLLISMVILDFFCIKFLLTDAESYLFFNYVLP
jgi:hypothetical protein